ncbi:MAG: hypothetical protein WB975_03610 [Nitrososphaeraceae archaeon]
MDKIEPELLRNGAVVNLLSVIDHHNMLSVIELLERKFAFKEIGYAIEQGVIAFNRPNPMVNLASNESANRNIVNSRNTCCYHHVLNRHVKLTELGHRMLDNSSEKK